MYQKYAVIKNWKFLARGILLRPLGNVLYFMPPYAIKDEEAHHVFDVIEQVLGKR